MKITGVNYLTTSPFLKTHGKNWSLMASTPLYVFSSRIFEYLHQVPISPRGEYELQDAIQMMIDEGQTVNGLFLNNRLTLTTPEITLGIM